MQRPGKTQALKPYQPHRLRDNEPTEETPQVNFSELVDLFKKLQEMQKEVLARLEPLGGAEQLHSMHQKITDHVSNLIGSFEKVKRGPQGNPGVTPYIDLDDVARRAVALIPVPKNGDTPVVDEHRIAKRAAKLVKLPEPGTQPAGPDTETIIEQIADMLRGGKVKIHASHIEGLEQTIEPVRDLARRASIRGGGDTVAAGTNITITRLANGQVRISSTGGGGITALAATETPNGVIKTFTFATAAAQPTYLRIDNALVKAINADGSVNWTWASIAKQATLSASQPPPNIDIEAII